MYAGHVIIRKLSTIHVTAKFLKTVLRANSAGYLAFFFFYYVTGCYF